MIGLGLRLLVFLAWLSLVSLTTAACTSWIWPYEVIAESQLHEMQALRAVGMKSREVDIHLVAMKDRAVNVQRYVERTLGEAANGDRIKSQVIKNAVDWIQQQLPREWWETKGRPHFTAYMQTWTIRMEIFMTVFLITMPLHLVSFWVGEYWSRKKIREGAHKRNSTIRAGLWLLRATNTMGAMLIGIVVAPPVVYWLAFFVIATIAITTLLRAYWIEPA